MTEERASRRWQRVRHALGTTLSAGMPRDDRHAVTVTDLSQTAACCAASVAMSEGDRIALRLGCVGEKVAVVEWVQEGRFGCRFLVPLRHQDVDRAFVRETVMTFRPGAPVERKDPCPTS